MSVRTGFIGVGAMGSPMALNILKAESHLLSMMWMKIKR